MPPFVRSLLDTNPPLLVRQLGEHRNLMRVVRYSSGTSEQGVLFLESMFATELIDIGKDLCLGQMSEDADALNSRMFFVVERFGMLGVFVLNLFLFSHGRGGLLRERGESVERVAPIGSPQPFSSFPSIPLIYFPRNREALPLLLTQQLIRTSRGGKSTSWGEHHV